METHQVISHDATVRKTAARREPDATPDLGAHVQPQQQQQQQQIIPDYTDVESTLRHDSSASTRTQSIAGTEDAVSINSRTRLFSRRFGRRRNSTASSSTSASTSTLQADKDDEGGGGTRDARRSTAPYLDSVHAARHPGATRSKKTPGRRAFEVACGIVEVLVTPLDIDGEKTSMKQSSVGRLFKKQQQAGEGEGTTSTMTGATRDRHRDRVVSMPF